LITVVNKSTLVSNADVQYMVRACAWQLRYHAAPAWGKVPIPVVYAASEATAPPGSWVIGVFDDSDQAGALGWHDLAKGDVVYGRVFARPVLTHGGNALTAPLSVASVLSHEVLETFCVAPDTRVLTDDLRWVPIGDVLVGEGLLGFDEYNPGQGSRRQWHRAVVESSVVVQRPCYDLTFEDGTQVRCSADHRWLAANGTGVHWLATDSLRPLNRGPDYRGNLRDQSLTVSRVLKPLDVWDSLRTYEAGYLAAAFEGEGCLSHYAPQPGKYGVSTRLTFAQNDNVMLERTQRYLKEGGFRFTEHCPPTGVKKIYVSNREDVLRLLGSVRPGRLLGKFQPDLLGSVTNGNKSAIRLIESRYVGEQPVVAMKTSTGTFLAEGMASHNCDPYCNLYADADGTRSIAVEIGDPVEADVYVVPVSGVKVTVSNYVLPRWFDPAAVHGPFDQMGHLTAPFTMTAGGYLIVMEDGQVTQQFGRKHEEWRTIEMKQSPLSRTARRMALARPKIVH
jgi:hypothetical protein